MDLAEALITIELLRGQLLAMEEQVAERDDQLRKLRFELELKGYEIVGEDEKGKLKGRHRSTGIGRPRFWERARYYGEEERLAAALDASEDKSVSKF